MNMKACGREESGCLRHYFRICLNRMRKTTETPVTIFMTSNRDFPNMKKWDLLHCHVPCLVQFLNMEQKNKAVQNARSVDLTQQVMAYGYT
jgi:hypothetical protein